MAFDYEKMLEEFRNNYYNQKWKSWKDLTYTWELLKILEEVPALNELSEFLSLNIRTLKRKLRKIFSNELYNNLMKDLKDRKAKMPETEFRELVDNGDWKKSPYDREIVMPRDVAIIVEKDGTRRKKIRSLEDGNYWPTGRGPHIIDATKILSQDQIEKNMIDDPKTKWGFIDPGWKFNENTFGGEKLSKIRDELQVADEKSAIARSKQNAKKERKVLNKKIKEFNEDEES